MDTGSHGMRAFRLERLAIFFGLYALLGGLVTLLGWALGVPRLTDWYSNGTHMKANAACAAMAGGGALLFHSLRGRPLWLVRGLAGFVALLGGLTLLEHLSGMDLGIDTFLWDESPGARATAAPGRMGPPASTACLLFGTGLLLATATGSGRRRRRAGGVASVLGLVITALSLLSLLGYLFGAQPLYDLPRVTGISLQMASMVGALGLGLLCSLPESQPARTLSENSAAGLLARRALPFILVLPVLLGWIRTVGEEAGLYDAGTGRALLILCLIILLCAVLWWSIHTVAAREDALLQSEQLFRTIGETVPDFLWVADKNGTPIYQNPAWSKYTGLTCEELRRSGWEVLNHPGDVPRLRALWKEASEHSRAFEFEARFRRHDGVFRWFMGHTVPLRTGDGEQSSVLKWIGTATDIDERQRAEAERSLLLERERSAREVAENATQLKDQFLATLSHELRTPLNAILGWSHLLKKDVSDAGKVHAAVEIIERNARLQAQLIADLLDLSRIVTGKMRLDIQLVELPAVIDAAVESMAPAAEAKGVRIQSLLDPLTEPVYGDPARLQQVIWNLLSNAVKFTPKGGRVQVILRKVESRVDITVSDTGEGIDPDFLPHIFERFRQADASESRMHPGLGIGLALVRQLVELHGGRVYAESEGKGTGATFVFHVPLAIVRAEPSAAHPRSMARPALDYKPLDLEGLTVLVVDDEEDGLEMVRRVLLGCRATVVTATSTDEALSHIEGHAFSVIISDIGMPARDGYELLMEVRKRGIRTPAVALTAFARADDRTKAMLVGYQTHIAKPVEPGELVATIASLTGRTGRSSPSQGGLGRS